MPTNTSKPNLCRDNCPILQTAQQKIATSHLWTAVQGSKKGKISAAVVNWLCHDTPVTMFFSTSISTKNLSFFRGRTWTWYEHCHLRFFSQASTLSIITILVIFHSPESIVSYITAYLTLLFFFLPSNTSSRTPLSGRCSSQNLGFLQEVHPKRKKPEKLQVFSPQGNREDKLDNGARWRRERVLLTGWWWD